MRYTRLTGFLLGIALAFATTTALADRDRHGGYERDGYDRGGYHHSEHRFHGQHHKYHKQHKKHKRHKPNRGWDRHHRPSRIVEQHVIVREPSRPRMPRRVEHHHSHSVPLVTVGGVPIVTIRSDY